MKIKKLKTLNEAIEEIIDDGTYSVMDHNLASSVKREAENKEKSIKLFDDKTKESALEDRDAHSKVSTPALKKMHLSESLFEEYDYEEEGALAFIDASGSAAASDMIDFQINLAKKAGATSFKYFTTKVYDSLDQVRGGGSGYKCIKDYIDENKVKSAIVVTDSDIENSDGKVIKNLPNVKIIRFDEE